MGADLIGFLVKGPVKFKKADIKKAEKEAEKIIDYARKVCTLLEKEAAIDGPTLSSDEEKFLENCLKSKELSGFNGQEQHDDPHNCDSYLETIATADAAKEVADFIRWWSGEAGRECRDTDSRIDPDDKKQQIVFCGESTWGDTPDGLGYATMRQANWFNIPENLGVR
jgi:hypothetical protein